MVRDKSPPQPAPLALEITFRPETGMFTARLANGAEIAFSPNAVSGKLGEALALYRGGVEMALAGDDWEPRGQQVSKTRAPLPMALQQEVDERLARGDFVQAMPLRVNKLPLSELSLDDLEIEL